MIQFITPIMQFVIGVRRAARAHAASSAGSASLLVWTAIVVFVVDLLLAARRGRRAGPAELV